MGIPAAEPVLSHGCPRARENLWVTHGTAVICRTAQYRSLRFAGGGRGGIVHTRDCHVSTVLTAKCPIGFACLRLFGAATAEAERLVKGVNILVVTPGRLLDHLQVGCASLHTYHALDCWLHCTHTVVSLTQNLFFCSADRACEGIPSSVS